MEHSGHALLLFFSELLAYVLSGYLKEKHGKLPARYALAVISCIVISIRSNEKGLHGSPFVLSFERPA